MKITGTIYLLSWGDGYGGINNIGCFSTEESAWECARKEREMFNKDTTVDYMKECGYWIDEFTLDEFVGDDYL
jgi:hypothetical protein